MHKSSSGKKSQGIIDQLEEQEKWKAKAKNLRRKTAAKRGLMCQTKMTSILEPPFPNRFVLKQLLFQAVVSGRRRHERRCKRIFDALETRYHQTVIGRFLYNASNITERKKNSPEEISYTFIYKMTEIDGEYLATTLICNED